MGEILNKEEIETLLSAVSAGKISTEKTKKIFKKTIIPYDFRKTNIAPRDQIRFLETIYQNFVRVYATSLGDFLKTMVEFKLANVEQIDFTYSQFSNNIYLNLSHNFFHKFISFLFRRLVTFKSLMSAG